MQILLNERMARIKAGLEELLVLASEPDYLWQDKIQEDSPLWGFDGIGTNNPGNVPVPPDDTNGVNLSRVPNPAGGFWLRHYADLSKPGAYIRSQAGIYGSVHKAFNDAASSGVYISHKCFLPRILSANGDAFSWLGLWDIHSKDLSGGNRSYLGMNVEQDGSMRAKRAWGGPLYLLNRDRGPSPPASKIALPVGRAFTIKTHFIRSTEPTTIRVWFDEELALQWDN